MQESEAELILVLEQQDRTLLCYREALEASSDFLKASSIPNISAEFVSVAFNLAKTKVDNALLITKDNKRLFCVGYLDTKLLI